MFRHKVLSFAVACFFSSAMWSLEGKTSNRPVTIESASFEIRCEGGECDERYIRKNLKGLESQLAATGEVLDAALFAEKRQHVRPERRYVVFHVVDHQTFEKIHLEFYPDRPLKANTDAFSAGDEFYFLRMAPQKQEVSLKTTIAGYISVIYHRAFGVFPVPEKLVDLAILGAARDQTLTSVKALRQEK